MPPTRAFPPSKASTRPTPPPVSSLAPSSAHPTTSLLSSILASAATLNPTRPPAPTAVEDPVAASASASASAWSRRRRHSHHQPPNNNTNKSERVQPSIASTSSSSTAYKMPPVPYYHQLRSGHMSQRRPTSLTPVRSFQKANRRTHGFVAVLIVAVPLVILSLFALDLQTHVFAPPQAPTPHDVLSPPLPIGDPAVHQILLSGESAVDQPIEHGLHQVPVISGNEVRSASTNAPRTTTTTIRPAVVKKVATAPQLVQKPPVKEIDLPPPNISEEMGETNSLSSGGVPPLSLPVSHPDALLLQSIRARTQMTPRWPMHATTQAQTMKSYGQAFSSILVSHKLKVVYIPVFKVATTSMMWNIAYLEGNPVLMHVYRTKPTGVLMKILHDMSSPGWGNHTVWDMTTDQVTSLFDDPSYLKFGFVRNPYDRIVSAYVDKVMRPRIEESEYQDQMYSLFGNDPDVRRRVNETRPSFREFLGAVKTIMEMPRINASDPMAKGFETNRSRRDMHWRPQVDLLHPARTHLDFVGHFDNMEPDRQVVIEWMQRHTHLRLPKAATGRLHSSDPRHKLELFESLRNDRELRDLLLHIYEEDFDRFHFSKTVPKSTSQNSVHPSAQN